MRICHKFVKELFIFVMAFTQIEGKKVLDEFRSQFAVFATQYTSVVPYGQDSTKKLFYLTTNHKICIDAKSNFCSFCPFCHTASGRNSVTSTTISNNSFLKISVSSGFGNTSFIYASISGTPSAMMPLLSA